MGGVGVRVVPAVVVLRLLPGVVKLLVLVWVLVVSTERLVHEGLLRARKHSQRELAGLDRKSVV